MDKEHLSRPIWEVFDALDDEIENGDYSMAIMKILEAQTEEDVQRALEIVHIGETWNVLSCVKKARDALKTVVDYAESDKATENARCKLRFIGFKLEEDQQKKKADREYDAAVILATLAMHGGVCHIQKEVGINTVYSMIAENMKEMAQASELENVIQRMLRERRTRVVEDVVYPRRKHEFGRDQDNVS